MDCSPPGSSVHGISQARLLESVAISFSRDLPNPGTEPSSPTLQVDSLPTEPSGKPQYFFDGGKILRILRWKERKKGNEVAQSCPTLCNPVDCSLPGSSVHGILQARVLLWVAISFSRDLPNPGTEPGSPAFQAYYLPSEPPGKPVIITCVHFLPRMNVVIR